MRARVFAHADRVGPDDETEARVVAEIAMLRKDRVALRHARAISFRTLGTIGRRVGRARPQLPRERVFERPLFVRRDVGRDNVLVAVEIDRFANFARHERNVSAGKAIVEPRAIVEVAVGGKPVHAPGWRRDAGLRNGDAAGEQHRKARTRAQEVAQAAPWCRQVHGLSGQFAASKPLRKIVSSSCTVYANGAASLARKPICAV